MQALNIDAEYRKYVAESSYMKWANREEFVFQNLQSGQWVEDDGDYYTREEWDSQYAEEDDQPDTDDTLNPDDADAEHYYTPEQIAEARWRQGE